MQTNLIKSSVKNAFLCKPVPNVDIRLFDINSKLLSHLRSDTEGKFNFQAGGVSIVEVEKSGFQKKQIPVNDTFPEIVRLLEDDIIGYQDKHGYQPGDKVTVYIHSTEEFTAELYRCGIKIEKILDLGNFNPCIQDVPNGLFVETGLNWIPCLKYKLPDWLRSGFYSLRLTSLTDKTKQYNLTFVVAPKNGDLGKNTKLLVLASTNNWQTYNIWGGRSRYRNFENTSFGENIIHLLVVKLLPEKLKNKIRQLIKKKIAVSVNDHPNVFQFKKLSVKRPHPNCRIRSSNPHQSFTSHLAEGEWRILAWLEKNNFVYDVVSGLQLHKNPGLLKNYNTFILSTHSEYWSKEMFWGLKKFFNEGGNILNLSGNSIYREVEFYDDGSLRCASLKFSERVEDETQLIGSRYDARGYGTCAPYEVLDPGHWIFKGTNMKRSDLFAKESLNNHFASVHPDFIRDPASVPGMALLRGKGGSGWETDKLSESAPRDFKLVAKGMNKFKGGADMLVREPDGHGLIFSASSITFGGTLLIDEICSKIMYNILSRCNTQLNESPSMDKSIANIYSGI